MSNEYSRETEPLLQVRSRQAQTADAAAVGEESDAGRARIGLKNLRLFASLLTDSVPGKRIR